MRKEPLSSERYQNRVSGSFWHLIAALLVTLGTLLNEAAGIDSGLGDVQGTNPQSAEKSPIEPFSLGYSLDYSPKLTAVGDAQCETGYPGVFLKGHLNEEGDSTRYAIQWIAHLGAPA